MVNRPLVVILINRLRLPPPPELVGTRVCKVLVLIRTVALLQVKAGTHSLNRVMIIARRHSSNPNNNNRRHLNNSCLTAEDSDILGLGTDKLMKLSGTIMFWIFGDLENLGILLEYLPLWYAKIIISAFLLQ